MKKIITGILLFLVARLIDKDVMNEIKSLVVIFINVPQITGAEKKVLITRQLKTIEGEFKENFAEISDWVISAGITIAYKYLKARM